ncbi:unnamed protein product [Spirodela intermedia]|uniref:Uncharacterized protein n=1 Tax=Spirodela intermedia TaxID=51605 RepID=A0A7I8JUB7_SPIIN|nr:unnamed protein product [Spirodela intermedia]CAA6673679.1 unnamed protein product [Spirodela intermedia]
MACHYTVTVAAAISPVPPPPHLSPARRPTERDNHKHISVTLCTLYK